MFFSLKASKSPTNVSRFCRKHPPRCRKRTLSPTLHDTTRKALLGNFRTACQNVIMSPAIPSLLRKAAYTLHKKARIRCAKIYSARRKFCSARRFFCSARRFSGKAFRNSPNASKERFGAKKMHFQEHLTAIEAFWKYRQSFYSIFSLPFARFLGNQGFIPWRSCPKNTL